MSRAWPVRSALESRVADGWMPGACWWFEDLATGRHEYGAVGTARMDMPYDLGGLTQTLATAAVALLLHQEGLLDFEAAIAEHVPELAAGPYAEVTVHDLGFHRAGFPAWRALYLAGGGIGGYLEQLAAVPPAVARGETLYSELGFLVLGAIVERVEGEPLDRSFARRLAGPLGLGQTGFAREGKGFEDAAPTEQGDLYERQMTGGAGDDHRWRSEIPRGEVHDGNARGLDGVAGHAGLFGTVGDVAAICREMLKSRRLPFRRSSREWLLRRDPTRSGRTFSMVLAKCSAAARGVLPDDSPGQTGFTGTSMWFEPDATRFYVLLSNRVHPRVQLRGFEPVRAAFHRAARDVLERD